MASRFPDNTVLKGSTFASSGFRLDYCRNPIQAIHHLRVHRVGDPQRAVLVKGGDALLRRTNFGGRVGGGFHEVEDGLLSRSLVPGGQRVLGLWRSCQPGCRED